MMENFCSKYNLEFRCDQSGLYFFQSFKNDRTTEYTIYSKIFNKFLHGILIKDKKLPDFIFGLDEERIKLFLYSYFKEGGFNCEYNYINKDIQFLLTYFGIYSRIKDKKLFIQKKYETLFYNTFGVEINKNNLEEDFQTLDDEELNCEATKLIYNFKDEYKYKKPKDIKILPEMVIKKIKTNVELNDFISQYIL